MNEHSVTSTIVIRKSRLTPDQRSAAKALLLDIDPTAIMNGGQLILHFGPGRSAFFGELQERSDSASQQLRVAS